MKKEEGKYYELTPSKGDSDKTGQKGLTEHLLCGFCDNVVIGRNELYFSDVLRGRIKTTATPLKKGFLVEGLDFEKTKRFFLSILWRLSISSRPSVEHISRGTKHEENIRLILPNEASTSEDEYLISCTCILMDGKFHEDFILPADAVRVAGNKTYRLVLNGFLYGITVGSAPNPVALKGLSISKEGSWYVNVFEVRDIPFLDRFFAKCASTK